MFDAEVAAAAAIAGARSGATVTTIDVTVPRSERTGALRDLDVAMASAGFVRTSAERRNVARYEHDDDAASLVDPVRRARAIAAGMLVHCAGAALVIEGAVPERVEDLSCTPDGVRWAGVARASWDAYVAAVFELDPYDRGHFRVRLRGKPGEPTVEFSIDRAQARALHGLVDAAALPVDGYDPPADPP